MYSGSALIGAIIFLEAIYVMIAGFVLAVHQISDLRNGRPRSPRTERALMALVYGLLVCVATHLLDYFCKAFLDGQ
jgi:hypothetical protein